MIKSHTTHTTKGFSINGKVPIGPKSENILQPQATPPLGPWDQKSTEAQEPIIYGKVYKSINTTVSQDSERKVICMCQLLYLSDGTLPPS